MRRRPRIERAGEGIYEPNMTPLIDVSLVLVVILLVATPLAFQSSIAVRNAADSARQSELLAATERIEIDVHADGTVRVNRFVVPREALGQTLRPMLASSVTRTVIVRCDDDVSHADFVAVIDEAKTLGAGQIAVVGG